MIVNARVIFLSIKEIERVRNHQSGIVNTIEQRFITLPEHEELQRECTNCFSE